MNYTDRFLRETASYSVLDVMLADIAIRIQLTPTDYQTAVEHFDAINEWMDRADSPLHGRIELFYPQQPLDHGALFSPWRPALDDSVGIDEQLAGAGDEGGVVSFSVRHEASIELDQRLVPAEGGR